MDKAAEGFLKSFTSGDLMQFDRKFKPPIQTVPTARLILATNNRPRFSDRSGGLWRRMILIPFRITIAENDPGRVFGMDKPEWWEASGELPGVFNWALAGLDRLRQQDRFTQSQVCEQALADYRTENNPARISCWIPAVNPRKGKPRAPRCIRCDAPDKSPSLEKPPSKTLEI